MESKSSRSGTSRTSSRTPFKKSVNHADRITVAKVCQSIENYEEVYHAIGAHLRRSIHLCNIAFLCKDPISTQMILSNHDKAWASYSLKRPLSRKGFIQYLLLRFSKSLKAMLKPLAFILTKDEILDLNTKLSLLWSNRISSYLSAEVVNFVEIPYYYVMVIQGIFNYITERAKNARSAKNSKIQFTRNISEATETTFGNDKRLTYNLKRDIPQHVISLLKVNPYDLDNPQLLARIFNGGMFNHISNVFKTDHLSKIEGYTESLAGKGQALEHAETFFN